MVEKRVLALVHVHLEQAIPSPFVHFLQARVHQKETLLGSTGTMAMELKAVLDVSHKVRHGMDGCLKSVATENGFFIFDWNS
jgi:hypothetical protein